MFPYVDYRFYIEEYCGSDSVSANAFGKAAIEACQYIRYLTLGRSDNYVGIEVKYAACAVIEAYVDVYSESLGTSENIHKSDRKIKNENTDGYSVTYLSESTDGETREALFAKKAYPLAKKWLLPTGLLNRKVGGCRDHKYRRNSL